MNSLALELEEPLLVDQAARLDLAAAQHARDARGRSRNRTALMKPPSRMLTSIILQRRDAGLAGDRDIARGQRRPVARIGQRARLRRGDVQHFVRVA